MGIGDTIFTLVQTTLGAGIITLPYAVYANGIILGPALIIGAAFLSHYTGYLLVNLSHFRRQHHPELTNTRFVR